MLFVSLMGVDDVCPDALHVTVDHVLPWCPSYHCWSCFALMPFMSLLIMFCPDALHVTVDHVLPWCPSCHCWSCFTMMPIMLLVSVDHVFALTPWCDLLFRLDRLRNHQVPHEKCPRQDVLSRQWGVFLPQCEGEWTHGVHISFLSFGLNQLNSICGFITFSIH